MAMISEKTKQIITYKLFVADMDEQEAIRRVKKIRANTKKATK